MARIFENAVKFNGIKCFFGDVCKVFACIFDTSTCKY